VASSHDANNWFQPLRLPSIRSNPPSHSQGEPQTLGFRFILSG
jgi:hypothetical protein